MANAKHRNRHQCAAFPGFFETHRHDFLGFD